MDIGRLFKNFIFYSLVVSFFSVNISYGQRKKVEYDTLNIEGEEGEEIIEDEVMVEAPETEASEENRLEQSEKLNNELEDTMNHIEKDEIVEIKEDEIKPKKVEVEELEMKAPSEAPTKMFGFIFDNRKKALFETRARWKNFGAGLGYSQYFAGAYQISSTADEKNSDWESGLELSLEFGEINGWSFSPFLTFNTPTKSKDGYFTQFRYSLGGEAAYRIYSNIRARIGTSVLFTTIKGSNSELVEVGTNQGSFFTSAGPRTSILNTLDLGAEYTIRNFSIALRSSIVSAFESEKRDYIHGFFFKYYFDFSGPKSEIKGEHHGELIED